MCWSLVLVVVACAAFCTQLCRKLFFYLCVYSINYLLIFSTTRITAVEIDPIMLEVAEQYFELKQDNRFHVVIDDGLHFIERCHSEGKCR